MVAAFQVLLSLFALLGLILATSIVAMLFMIWRDHVAEAQRKRHGHAWVEVPWCNPARWFGWSLRRVLDDNGEAYFMYARATRVARELLRLKYERN